MTMKPNWPHMESFFHYKGYACVVLLQRMGHRCGYVGIPASKPHYGESYMHLENIECHGGLTYSDTYMPADVPNGLWWIGFDCAHWQDAPDVEATRKIFGEYEALRAERLMDSCLVVRTQEYCEEQCRNIVDQLFQEDK